MQGALHASAEPAADRNDFKSTTVSPFPDMSARQQATVQKPYSGHLQNESLQKSATTKATTVKASCLSIQQTPKEKLDFLAESNEGSDCQQSQAGFTP